MIPKPKFSLGQHVYVVTLNTQSVYQDCTACLAQKYIVINNQSFTCPKCHGSGNFFSHNIEKYSMSFHGHIGKITIEAYSKKYCRANCVKYMLDESGVGSGSIWCENQLFLSEEAALREVKIRNKNHEEKHSD